MADDKQWFQVSTYEYEGGAPQFRIYNAKSSFHALLKLLAYLSEESAEGIVGDGVTSCIYLGDDGFRLIRSNRLTEEEKIIHCEDDIIRIE